MYVCPPQFVVVTFCHPEQYLTSRLIQLRVPSDSNLALITVKSTTYYRHTICVSDYVGWNARAVSEQRTGQDCKTAFVAYLGTLFRHFRGHFTCGGILYFLKHYKHRARCVNTVQMSANCVRALTKNEKSRHACAPS